MTGATEATRVSVIMVACCRVAIGTGAVATDRVRFKFITPTPSRGRPGSVWDNDSHTQAEGKGRPVCPRGTHSGWQLSLLY